MTCFSMTCLFVLLRQDVMRRPRVWSSERVNPHFLYKRSWRPSFQRPSLSFQREKLKTEKIFPSFVFGSFSRAKERVEGALMLALRMNLPFSALLQLCENKEVREGETKWWWLLVIYILSVRLSASPSVLSVWLSVCPSYKFIRLSIGMLDLLLPVF